MGERALKWALRLVGVFLYVGPLLAAFLAQGGNFLAAVLPSQQQMDRVGQKMDNLFNFSDNVMEKESYSLNENGGEAVVRFTNPSAYSIVIENFTGWAVCPQHRYRLAWFQLKERVGVGPGQSERLTLTFYPTPEAAAHVIFAHLGFWPEPEVENAVMRLGMLGGEIEVGIDHEGTEG
jgi:hypothetical protein